MKKIQKLRRIRYRFFQKKECTFKRIKLNFIICFFFYNRWLPRSFNRLAKLYQSHFRLRPRIHPNLHFEINGLKVRTNDRGNRGKDHRLVVPSSYWKLHWLFPRGDLSWVRGSCRIDRTVGKSCLWFVLEFHCFVEVKLKYFPVPGGLWIPPIPITLFFHRQLGCLAFSLIFWPKIKQLLSNCRASDLTFSS